MQAGPVVACCLPRSAFAFWLCCLPCPAALAGSRGLVVSWGRGEDGQLGHGDAEERTQPQAIFGLLNAAVSSVYCGAEYSLAISRRWGHGV